MTATHDFIATIQSLKAGDLGRLRKLANRPLDETVDGFDLFAGLWWPLRQKNQFAPRREVAWLIAKLYGFCPVEQQEGTTLARQLGTLPKDENCQKYQRRFDRLLQLPLNQLEEPLQQILRILARYERPLDWIRLTDDLSRWENQEIRLRWAKEYLGQNS
ncbi:MAG: type I-E CRISPR-associated protein Cse2/CasB [Phycisphaerae bacterium]|jgi:CRISPR type I-E-associated protein CasB/Cse2|nr:type I-E CRISPR-associated protein Cse2/CasB [Phycisphaerae bacterium]